MTNAELLAKIKAEIDRLYGEYKDKFHQCGDQYHLGLIDGLDMAERVLDTFEKSEKPINPEDAMKLLEEKIALVKQMGTWDGVDVDKFMDEVRGREPEKPVPNDLEEYASRAGFDYVDNIVQEHPGHRFNDHDVEYAYRDGIIAGAKWQADHTHLPEDTVLFNKGVAEGKRLMMEDAVEAIVEDWNPDPKPEITIPLNPEEFTCGDKVRVIVLPNED